MTEFDGRNHTHDFPALIDRLAGHHIIVVGDVILDEYLIGKAERMSREAPIPVLEFQRRDVIPGGAANPSVNIASMGSQVLQVGVVGADENGNLLQRLLQERGIQTDGIVIDPQRPTTTKTRIVAQMGLRFPQQIARLDQISRTPIGGSVELAVIEAILHAVVESSSDAGTIKVITASDYLTGLLTPAVVRTIREVCSKHGIQAVADAQGDLAKYAGFDVVKCNVDEASLYVRAPLNTDQDITAAGLRIVRELTLKQAMLITRGAAGMTLVFADERIVHLSALHIEDVFDTVGAGDTVLAFITLGLSAGLTLADSAHLANLAAGIVIRKVGNYAPTREDLLAALAEE